jgi:ribosomal protein S18 acetylase RimI-like enzyme
MAEAAGGVTTAGGEPLAVERASAADADAIVALVNSAYRGDSSRAGWTTEADLLGGQRTDRRAILDVLADDGRRLLVHRAGGTVGASAPVEPAASAGGSPGAIDPGALLACVLLERKPAGRCYLGMLTVRPDLQAAGLGRRLLEAAERYAAAELGATRIEMTVIGVRAELIAWYERRGYLRTGERRPFPYGDERFGLPRRPDLDFEVLGKALG